MKDLTRVGYCAGLSVTCLSARLKVASSPQNRSVTLLVVSDVINKRIDQLTDGLMDYIRQNYSLMMVQSDIASLDVCYQI
jgi:hypothetical protein